MPRNAFGQEIGDGVHDWHPRLLPSRAALTGEVCRVEPLDADKHAADLFDAFAAAPDGRDWTYLPIERPPDLATYRKVAAAQAVSSDPRHYAIIDLATGRPVGTAAFMRIDPANGVIEIGHILFSPRLQRSRAGTEALFLMFACAFDALGYRRLEWKCDGLNGPSRRAALRLGFTFEGVFRQAIVTKARSRDTAWYAIVDRDWPAVRAAFQSWLSAANFDPNGRQIRSLSECRAAASVQADIADSG